jgi:hypothetical protein
MFTRLNCFELGLSCSVISSVLTALASVESCLKLTPPPRQSEPQRLNRIIWRTVCSRDGLRCGE